MRPVGVKYVFRIIALPRLLFTILLLCALSLNCLGADIYIAQTAQGTGDGSSAANAQSLAWMNGYGSQVTGNTYHVVGIITNEVDLQASWTTLYFEPNAKISQPASFNGIKAVSTGGNTNIIVDGGSNGIIEYTQNGSGLTYSNAPAGVVMTGSANITVRNLHFSNFYIHTDTNDQATAPMDVATAIDANGAGGSNYFYNCTFSNICWCILVSGAIPFLSASNCAFVNFDHGIIFNATNMVITDCDFGSTACWDTSSDRWHHDAVHYFLGSVDDPSPCESWVISNNKFHGNWGNANTAFLFLEYAPSFVTIANNVFLGQGFMANGMVVASGNTNLIYNNSFLGGNVYLSGGLNIGAGGGGDFASGTGGLGSVVENNLFSGLNTFIVNQSTNHIETFNNNVYANVVSGGNVPFASGGVLYSTFSQWQSAIGGDSNSVYTTGTVVNTDGTLPASSPAIGAGANLSGIFTTDIKGLARAVKWDVGAYEYATNAISPPFNLHSK